LEAEDGTLLPEEQVLSSERADIVRRALSSLGADQQEAISLRFFGEFSFAEVGTTLGRSEPAAKMLVQRGLRVLRRRLALSEGNDA
jgi:RNA polymerase sigma factor (sigma-70 family)